MAGGKSLTWMTSMPIPATYLMIRIQPSIFLFLPPAGLPCQWKARQEKGKNPSCCQPQLRQLTEEEVRRLPVEMWPSDRVGDAQPASFLGAYTKSSFWWDLMVPQSLEDEIHSPLVKSLRKWKAGFLQYVLQYISAKYSAINIFFRYISNNSLDENI